jgi:hypothetical protein
MIVKTVERAIGIYASLAKHPVNADTRANLSTYLELLLAQGVTDRNRLTVHGLAYLRNWDLKATRNV